DAGPDDHVSARQSLLEQIRALTIAHERAPPSASDGGRPYTGPFPPVNIPFEYVEYRTRPNLPARAPAESGQAQRRRTVAVARTGALDPVHLPWRPRPARHNRDRARARPRRQHNASVHRDPGAARLPRAGSGGPPLPASRSRFRAPPF